MAVVEARPVAFQGDLRNLPKALAPLEALPNWVCWKWNWKVRRNGVGKWDKPPYQPTRPENFARNNDPTTWGTYKQALAIFEGGGCDGIGFNLSRTEFGAFDIDNCRDKDTGVIAPEALVIVDQAASYTEVTVSGTGLRVIGFGKGSKLHRRQRISSSTVEVETYRNAERYIVITGNPLPGVCLQLSNIDIALDAVVADLDAGNIDRELSASRHIGTTNFSLPQGLSELIDNGVPAHQDLSAAFHRAVCWLHDLGFSLAQIEGRISGKPIVPPRFADRLVGEISRCVNKAKPFREGILHQGIFEQHDQTCAGRSSTKPPLEILWHGQQDRRTSRPWLVKDLIPERGQGLASGQWGAAKTFAMIDLCSSVMTALPFAGREVVRQGGVLFIAAEGAAEIPIRLQGVVDHKIRGAALAASAGNFAVLPDLDKLPFAWIEEDPSLRDDMERINAASHFAACKIREQFDLPLVLIIVDTLNAVARFKDGNDAAEGQFVMNQLNSLSRATGAFVLAVDHFGKAAESGTRGSSAKEAAADVVLAFLADRDLAGNISKTRMSVRKLRGGSTGHETPFSLKVVEAIERETTCVIDWSCELSPAPDSTMKRDRWTRSTKVLRAALNEVLSAEGREIDPYGDALMKVQVVTVMSVRKEFLKKYLADGEDAKKNADAKRNAFNRALMTAQDRGLICGREIDGVDHLWLATDHS